ncbi:tRNA (guanosine(37)-N1)-methyltransferase TrmD [Parasphaerochaeta coccoides]|uniref:tRNA (guanine-N(1)-)-methyltransferase n=1 Tax=Parasphaerochaeta coccoides (strain ATCC BAA-1237 / DSM 17374 / SPN1) TaxID=760011 RepID=F4GJA1_PARC1|nr:tRNA (guanosine(37)-N1)-methyltransferase TrmD [Parasphaerochaeta coccoides]AEC01741.1 tRNA (Guanine37-N(1)-) methyltransferase [Parasphaerochaeta coccoides DSM 17374]
MNITILTLFPEMVEGFFTNSIMARSVASGLVMYKITNFRDYAEDRHHTCDDAPYGGGAGMVLKPEPLFKALEAADAKNKHVVLPSPSGRRFTQEVAERLSKEKELLFICGHYEGIDQRVIDTYVDEELSVGDYVISSGEVAVLVMVDAIYRLIDGVISEESLKEESFSDGLLEYPHYTRPETYCGKKVPDVLLSGHHANIARWRQKMRLRKTLLNRPELLENVVLDAFSRKILDELRTEREGD